MVQKGLYHAAPFELSVDRPSLLKSVLGFFVFLAAFLSVATYLGGGVAGLLWAGLVAAVLLFLYLLFYGWIARRPSVGRDSEQGLQPGSMSSSANPGDRPSPPTVSTQTRITSRTRSRPRPEPPKQDLAENRAHRARSVCDSGPYDVESGRPTKILLDVESGFALVGTLEEEDGDDFEFMIIDEDNWVMYQQGRTYDVEDEGDGEGAYKINWSIPSDGPWFLILDAYGKQLVREVSVNLRLSAGS